jgi:hypothetical protein
VTCLIAISNALFPVVPENDENPEQLIVALSYCMAAQFDA